MAYMTWMINVSYETEERKYVQVQLLRWAGGAVRVSEARYYRRLKTPQRDGTLWSVAQSRVSASLLDGRGAEDFEVLLPLALRALPEHIESRVAWLEEEIAEHRRAAEEARQIVRQIDAAALEQRFRERVEGEPC